MDKSEFLNKIRETLNGEVSNEVIERNVRYYDDYLNSPILEETDRKINELGDPRLIAKTIIDTEKIAKEKSRNYYDQSTYSENQTQEDDPDWEKKWEEGNSGLHPKQFFMNLKWQHKLIAVFSIIVLIIFIVLIGRLLIGVLFTIGPVILLLLLFANLFRRRR